MTLLLVILALTVQSVFLVTLACPVSSPCSCENSDNSPKRTIVCTSKGLTNLPTFTTSTEVFAELNLQLNTISTIGPNAFQGLRVEKIDMSEGNKLAQIDANAFNGVENLKSLYLEGNQNIAPPFEQMKNLNLSEMHLSYFKLQTINENTPFNYWPNLKILALRQIGVTFFSSNTFSNGQLQEITKFQFENNYGVTTLPVPAINRLRTLTHLSWTGNDMSNVPTNAFSSLSNLLELDLRQNKISSFDSNCFNGINNNLQFLGLHINDQFITENNIVALRDVSWPNLEQLNLGHNNLQSIPDGLFRNMPKLANLDLPGNKLRKIEPMDFQGLSNMHSIDLSENRIAQIEAGSFSHMGKLDTLDLRNQYDITTTNKMNFSIDAVSGIESSLKTLHIHENVLDENFIWDAIAKMVNLVNLDMSNTKLSNIPDLVFFNHKSLQSLRIAKNGISNLTQASLFGLSSSLSTISLTDNNLQTIDECVFEGFSRLKLIFLQNNPLTCDCKLLWLYDWIKNQPASASAPYITMAKCSNPASLKDKQLGINVPRDSLTCQGGYTKPVCPDLTPATTAPPPSTTTITTVASTTNIPLPTINLAVSSKSTNNIVISWILTGDATYVNSFSVEYRKLGVSFTPISFPADKTEHDKVIANLEPDSSYFICLYLVLTSGTIVNDPECVTVLTDSNTPVTTQANTGDDEGANTGIIVGGVLGAVLGLGIIVVILFILLKKRADPGSKYPPPPAAALDYRPNAQPRVSYDSKVFTKSQQEPVKNGDIQIRVISDGKNGPARISAGSYQNIDANATFCNDPYPVKGASGVSSYEKQQHVKLPSSKLSPSMKSRYTSMPPASTASVPPHYVNEVHKMASEDHYANGVEKRPLPQTPAKPLSDSSAGFLNHGFASSPTDSEYHEITSDMGTVV